MLDLENLKKIILDILPKSRDEALNHHEIMEQVEAKMKLDMVTSTALDEALIQLCKEGRITDNDACSDAGFYIKK